MVQAMRSLREDPRPSGYLKLDDLLYRLRIGQYRIVYVIFEDELIVFVCKATRRTEATYRDLQQLLDRAL